MNTKEAVPRVRRVALSSLHLEPANARTHDGRNLDSIEASLQRFETLGTDQGAVDRWPGTGSEALDSSRGHAERFSVATRAQPFEPLVIATGGNFELPWTLEQRTIYDGVELGPHEGNYVDLGRRRIRDRQRQFAQRRPAPRGHACLPAVGRGRA